jgi:hypothetical protein
LGFLRLIAVSVEKLIKQVETLVTYGIIFKKLIKSIPKIHKMVESVALTTDLWTSNYSTISYDSYMPFFEREKISQYFFRYFTVSRNSQC